MFPKANGMNGRQAVQTPRFWALCTPAVVGWLFSQSDDLGRNAPLLQCDEGVGKRSPTACADTGPVQQDAWRSGSERGRRRGRRCNVETRESATILSGQRDQIMDGRNGPRLGEALRASTHGR